MNDFVVSPVSSIESMRCTSLAVPSVTATSACVWPRVKSAEPWARGRMPVSIVIGRTSFGLRPSTRSSGVEHLGAQSLYSMSPTRLPMSLVLSRELDRERP